jgi:hypothetical protein
MIKNDFTVKQAIEIQTRQLERWKLIIKPEIFEIIKDSITQSNIDAKTGFDVKRGSDIDDRIHWAMKELELNPSINPNDYGTR